ncbi:MAG: ComEC/Rec2 family competence protein [Propionibacteriaceae bacterium]|nr:ComEC/Rec2 family competence protein [Propionibacteriaceae bacterium]
MSESETVISKAVAPQTPGQAGVGADRPDLRLVVPGLAVWASMWALTGWRWSVWIVAGVAVCCLGVGLVLRRVGAASASTRSVVARLMIVVGLLTASCVVVGGMTVASVGSGPLAQAGQDKAVVEFDLQIRTARLSSSWGQVLVNGVVEQFTVRGQTYRAGASVMVRVPQRDATQWLQFPAGTTVRLTGKATQARLSDGVTAWVSALSPASVIRPPPAWQRIIESMRTGLVRAMNANPAEQAALVPALVVGETSGMPPQLTSDFTTTGLTHLTAVSGANLAILLSFLTVVARYVGVRGWGISAVSVIGVAVFIMLCHSEPSVLRAAAMGLVALMALGRGTGHGGAIRGLCLAVMGLCWLDPWMSRSWGFILSALACLGIIWWGRRWSELLGRWLPAPVAEAMAIPLAAQVSTQPVICWLSGAVSVSGLLANAGAAPWVGPATVVGLIAALVSPVSATVASWAGYIAGWCAQPILLVGHGLAGLPGSSHWWPATVWGMLIVTAACLAVARAMPLLLSSPLIVVVVSLGLVVAMMAAPYHPGWPGSHWRVAACDVGQADGVAVRVDGGEAIVIDVGLDTGEMVQCLRQLGVTHIPVLVLTHLHADHAGGLAGVMQSFTVGQVVTPRGGGSHGEVDQICAERGIRVDVATTGQSVTVGDVRLSVVSAFQASSGGDDAEESSGENDESLIVRVDSPQMSLIDTGDVEVAGQQAALRHADELRADILKVPHHGSSRQVAQFLQATGARFAVISVGADNDYGHPTKKALTLLSEVGMEVIRTDEHGSITFARDQEWTLTTQR